MKAHFKIKKTRLFFVGFLVIIVKSTANNSSCKFKSNYFSEFDLNPVAKIDGSLYTTEELTFRRMFRFNLCEPDDGTMN